MNTEQEPDRSMRYLTLAEQLLKAADKRPDQRLRLSTAADVATDLANLCDVDDNPIQEWIGKAASLLRDGVTEPLQSGVVASARTYERMAATRARKLRVARDQDREQVDS